MVQRARRFALRFGRLAMARARHPGVVFGRGCDIRKGLHLWTGAGALVVIGPKCVVDRSATIECHGLLEVGARVVFGHHVTIGVRDRVVIGADSMIAELVSIRDHDHRFADRDTPVREQGMETQPVTIGTDVWLGSKVSVMRGVTIGDRAVVGAGAVVTADIPAGAIAVGVPARVIGWRVPSVEDGGARK
jgi:acetyltransferase-like isoleucine patch superfamily enzyme